MASTRIKIDNEQEMADFGAKLGRELLNEKRDRAAILQLVGDLGAGKTTLARGIARGLGIDATITSPTFQVHKEYVSEDNKTELHHFDFYRLHDLGIMKHELGELITDPNNVLVIEWGGILGDLAKNAKTIKIEKITDEKRNLLLE